jgi:hypothetical protein
VQKTFLRGQKIYDSGDCVQKPLGHIMFRGP